jgi:hypothetical protein
LSLRNTIARHRNPDRPRHAVTADVIRNKRNTLYHTDEKKNICTTDKKGTPCNTDEKRVEMTFNN